MVLARPKIRHDLIYTPDGAEPGYFYVKDPIRATFYRFNELQVGMMQALDGVRSYDAIVEHIGETCEVEVSIASVQRMVARLEKDLLLDVSSYRVSSAKDRALVRNALKKRALVWRPKDGHHEGGARKPSRETELFQRGIDEIETGDPCKASQHFSAVIEINPQNGRARAILDTIHQAFFQRHRVTPAQMVMLHVWDPDGFLEKLDRAIGAWLFSGWALVLLFGLAALSVHPLMDANWPSASSFTWIDVLTYIPLSFVFTTLHELGHGVSCKHFGGRVNDMGLLLIYGVWPGAYCDTSDSYLFKDKRHKVIVSLAGMYVSVCCNMCALLVFHYSADSFFLRKTLLILLALGFWEVFKNLVPFIALDGYYALADWLEIRNLRERSFAYLGAVAKRTLLGIRGEEEGTTRREKRIFLWFGASALVFTAFYVYGLWISLLLPLAVRHLGTFGVIFTAIYAFRMFRSIIIAPASLVLRLVLQHRKEVFTPVRCVAYVAAIGATCLLLSLPWPFYVDGEALLQPAVRRVVRATEPGILVSVPHREGTRVRAGEVVASLRSDELLLEREVLEHELAKTRWQLEMLRAGTRPEEIELARAKAQEARVATEYAMLDAERKTKLKKESVLTGAAAVEAGRDARMTSDRHTDATLSLALARAGTRIEDLAAAESEVRRLEAKADDLEARERRLTITSPIDGVIVGRKVEELLGRSLHDGDALFEVQDISSLRLEIYLPPSEHFSGVKEGQRVSFRTRADPHLGFETEISQIRKHAADDGALIADTEAAGNPGWPSNVTGHARIYGAPRSLAYRLFWVEVLRLIQYEGWRIWGSS